VSAVASEVSLAASVARTATVEYNVRTIPTLRKNKKRL
jgi:hypothetical protein